MKTLITTLTLFLLAGTTSVWAATENVVASNGVRVGIDKDEFKPYIDVSADWISELKGELPVEQKGYLFFIRKDKSGSRRYVQGSITYYGDWRWYDRAYLFGGEPAKFISLDRKVGKCSVGRFGSSCSMTEDFQLEITSANLSEADDLRIKIASQKGIRDFVVVIPRSHIIAVEEVAGKQ